MNANQDTPRPRARLWRTSMIAISVCVAALAVHFTADWMVSSPLRTPLPLEKGYPIDVQFMARVSGYHTLAIEALREPGVASFDLMGLYSKQPGQAIGLTWRVIDSSGQIVAEDDAGDIRRGSYVTNREVGRYIGRFEVRAFRTYRLQAKVRHAVEFPARTYATVRTLDDGSPRMPVAVGWLFYANLLATYVAIPGALIWWVFKFLRRGLSLLGSKE